MVTGKLHGDYESCYSTVDQHTAARLPSLPRVEVVSGLIRQDIFMPDTGGPARMVDKLKS